MLSEDGADAAAMFDHLAGAFIDHGPEAGKYFEFEKLSIVEPQALRRCLEDGGLRLAADARDTLSNIDRGVSDLRKKDVGRGKSVRRCAMRSSASSFSMRETERTPFVHRAPAGSRGRLWGCRSRSS